VLAIDERSSLFLSMTKKEFDSYDTWGQSYKKLFCVNILTIFCKRDCLIIVHYFSHCTKMVQLTKDNELIHSKISL
jgi:hypothetical protein